MQEAENVIRGKIENTDSGENMEAGDEDRRQHRSIKIRCMSGGVEKLLYQLGVTMVLPGLRRRDEQRERLHFT